MIHHKIKNNHGKSSHYAVGHSKPYNYGFGDSLKLYEGGILLQVAEDDQSRICLTVDEAQHIVELLQNNIKFYQESLKQVE